MNTQTHQGKVYEQTEVIPEVLEVHPSVSARYAKGLIAACDYFSKYPEHFNINHASRSSKNEGCIVCIANELVPGTVTNEEMLDNTVSHWDKNHQRIAGFQYPRGDIRRVWYMSQWPSQFSPQKKEDAVPRTEHFLRTGE